MSSIRDYIRNHYVNTMLTVIVLSVAGSLALLAFVVVKQSSQLEQSTEQLDIIRTIADEISTDQQKQHNKHDERQQCFFELFVSYVNTKEPIEKADADKCRVVPGASQSTQTNQGTQTTPEREPTPPVRPEREEPTTPTPEEPVPTEPEPSFIERLLQPVTNLLN